MQTKFDAVPRLEGFTNAFFVPILAALAALRASGSGDHCVGERSRFFVAREDGPRQPKHKDGYLLVIFLTMTYIPREASTHLIPESHRETKARECALSGNH